MLARIKPRMSVPMSSSSSASSTLEQQYLPNSMLSDNCMQQFLLNDPYPAGLNLKGSHNFCYNKEAPTLSMNYHQSNRMINPLSQSLLSEIATKMQHITMPMSLSSNFQSFSDHLSEGNQVNFHQASALSLPLLKEWAYQNAVAGCGGSYTQLLTNPVGFSRMDSFSAMPQEAHALREFSQRLAGGALSRTVTDAASPALFESNLSQCLHQAALQQRSEPLPSCKSWNVSNPAMAGLVPDQNTFNGSIEGIAQYPFEHSGFAEGATRFPSLTSENLSSFITPLATSGHASPADPALRGSSMLVSGCEDIKDPKIQLNSKACYSEHKLPQSQADLYVEDVSKSISTLKKRRSGSDDSLSAGKRPKAEEQTVGDTAAGKRQKCQSSSKVKEEVKGKSNCSVETGPNVGGKDKAGKATDAPKQDYIHVRARRGQATDSHSLAERVRREKISERMRLLQDLVPGCSKITGKAMMLDEIINYVQSLQHQVEFLSMKLAALSPRVDFNFDNFYMGEVMPSEGSPTEVNANVSEMGTSASLSYQMLQSSMGAAVRDSCEDFCAPIPSESSLIDTKATTRSPCTANLPTNAFSQAACEWESNDNA